VAARMIPEGGRYQPAAFALSGPQQILMKE
jgi:hypothetical protein